MHREYKTTSARQSPLGHRDALLLTARSDRAILARCTGRGDELREGLGGMVERVVRLTNSRDARTHGGEAIRCSALFRRSLARSSLQKFSFLSFKVLLQSHDSLLPPIWMALARRHQRLRFAYDTDKISDARIAQVVVMDISSNRDASSPCNFRLTGLSLFFSHGSPEGCRQTT